MAGDRDDIFTTGREPGLPGEKKSSFLLFKLLYNTVPLLIGHLRYLSCLQSPAGSESVGGPCFSFFYVFRVLKQQTLYVGA